MTSPAIPPLPGTVRPTPHPPAPTDAARVVQGFRKGGLDRTGPSTFMNTIARRRIHQKPGFAEGDTATLHSPARDAPAPSITLSLDRQDWTPIP